MKYVEINSALTWLIPLLNDVNKKYKTIFTDVQFKFGNVAKTWFNYFKLRGSLVRGILQKNIFREGFIYYDKEKREYKELPKVVTFLSNPSIYGLCVFSNHFYQNDPSSNLVYFAIKDGLDEITKLEVILHEIAHFLHYSKFVSKQHNDSKIPMAIKIKNNHSNMFKKFYIDLLNIDYKDKQVQDLIKQMKTLYHIPVTMGFTVDMLDTEHGVLKNYNTVFQMNGNVE